MAVSIEAAMRYEIVNSKLTDKCMNYNPAALSCLLHNAVSFFHFIFSASAYSGHSCNIDKSFKQDATQYNAQNHKCHVKYP